MTRDVIELIEQDHRELQAIFTRLRSGDGDREMLFQTMAALLTAHSRAEEAEVYPALSRAGDQKAKEDVKHARQEHAEADDLLAKLKGMDVESAGFEQTLSKLIEAVNHHIEEEESTALPELRAASDSAQLDRLAKAFTERRGAELMAGPSPRQVGGSEMTKDKLYEKAKEHNLKGRASMTKEELAEAVKTAEKSG